MKQGIYVNPENRRQVLHIYGGQPWSGIEETVIIYEFNTELESVVFLRVLLSELDKNVAYDIAVERAYEAVNSLNM